MSELSDKVRKTKTENINPQMTRLKMMEKVKKSNPRRVVHNHKRKTPTRKKSPQILGEKSTRQYNPSIQSSLSITEKTNNKKPPVVAESEPQQEEVTPPDLSLTGEEKSAIWNDLREDELEARLEKLQKILGKIKEEKLHQLKEKIQKWQEKYERRLLDLEMSMRNFETRCKYDKAEIGEQISRVEEMSDMNNAIRQRLGKKVEHLVPRMQFEENNRYFTTATVNLVKLILYYTAKIRDALWKHSSTKKRTPADANSSSSRTNRTDNSEKIST